MSGRDVRLRQRFAELREETERSGRVPDARAMLARAAAEADARPDLRVAAGSAAGRTRRRRLVRTGAWASAALAAAVAGLLLVRRGPSGDEEFARLVQAYAADASAGAWRSPTSRLLDVPGMELMRSVPSIGRPLPGLDPTTLPAPPEAVPEENS
ncbi:MAG TPA: hypothetical protein VFQ22_05965 [Longimicrobiales bacterium]|nr:hypothetical protein [Longimicrobiales bacterium]